MRKLRPSAATRDALVVGLSRFLALSAIVVLIGMLPWLSGRSPEYTVLRARYAELEATPEALASVRAELGLDQGPFVVFLTWLGGLLRGDAGTSWINNKPVLPGIVDALGVSLTLMMFSIAVALLVASALCVPAVVAGLRARPTRGAGVVATTLTALPEFLLAAVLLIVGAVWLRLFPPFGWAGLENAVLPALALGLPAGGLIGKLVSDAITAAFSEPWVTTWRLAGFPRGHVLRATLQRALPGVLGQVGLVLVGLTGGAVAVEEVFSIPGLGRATLGAASAQDIPTLQAGMLALLFLAVVVGVLVAGTRVLLLGPALRFDSVPVPTESPRRRRDLIVPITSTAILAILVMSGLFRDPYATTHGRLTAPSLALPFGSDASGRDLLGRVAHGSLTTLGVALLVVLACLIIGLILGCFPRAITGPLEVTNAAPPIIAGLIVAAIAGPSVTGAAVAVAAVSWAPLAAHTASLVIEARAQPYVRVLPVLGVSRPRILLQHVLPSVVGPVTRHAMLRLPGIALAIAALGFLGLGTRQPTPEWGLILAEGIGYVERAPWAVLAPSLALVLASIIAVSIASLGSRQRRPSIPMTAAEAPVATAAVDQESPASTR